MLWSIDDERHDGQLVVRYPYFEEPQPLVYDSDLTYVETDARFEATRTAVWNHSIGEIVRALVDRGLQVTSFAEHDSVPWNALPGQMAKDADGEWRLMEAPRRLAASYTLQAVKEARVVA